MNSETRAALVREVVGMVFQAGVSHASFRTDISDDTAEKIVSLVESRLLTDRTPVDDDAATMKRINRLIRVVNAQKSFLVAYRGVGRPSEKAFKDIDCMVDGDDTPFTREEIAAGSEPMDATTINIGRVQVLAEIDQERDRQNEKWGRVQQLPDYTYLAIATEELGEAAQAMLHDEFGGDHAGTMRTELVQLAAVVVQWIERMDMEAANAS